MKNLFKNTFGRMLAMLTILMHFTAQTFGMNANIDAGDFTASELVEALVKADSFWADNQLKADYIANVDVANAVISEQTANISALSNPEKDQDIRITWINDCDETTEADSDDCNIGGAELHSDKKVLALNIKRKIGFTVDEKVWRANNHNMPEAVAKGFLKKGKALDEYIAQQMVAKIETFKGVNALTDGKGTVVGTETYVEPADWNANLFAYLLRTAIRNKFANPYLLSGNNLYEANLNTMLAQGNAEGKGDAAKFKIIRKYFDLFNIDTVNDPTLKTYLINRGAIAFASKAYYSSTPREYIGAGQTRYSIPSRNIPGVRYDVYYTNRCTSDTIKHDFTLRTKFDIFLNPTGCVATRTGVLSFINDNAPEGSGSGS